MTHKSETRWEPESTEASFLNKRLIDITLEGEEKYRQFQEVYAYCNNDLVQLANLWHMNDKDLTTASALQITQVTDLRLSLLMHHEAYEHLNNVIPTQRDRYNLLRNLT